MKIIDTLKTISLSFLISFGLALPFPANAQTNAIADSMQDAKRQGPVFEAMMLAKEFNISVETDADGHYMDENYDGGVYNSSDLEPHRCFGQDSAKLAAPDCKHFIITDEKVDEKTVINLTAIGKLINNSSKEFTSEQMQEYADRIVSAIASIYTGSDGDISWKGTANITVVSKDNPLSQTDLVIKIVDEGNIPIPGMAGNTMIVGGASYGGKVVYLSTAILNNTPATEGIFAGTGKNRWGAETLERTVSHELGHIRNLRHPDIGTQDGNLMHQGRQPNAGIKLTKEQIIKMKEDYTIRLSKRR